MRDSGAQRGAYAPVVDTYEPVAAAPHTTALGRFMAHMALMYRGLVFGLTWHAALMVSVTCFCTFLCSQKMFDIKFNTSMQILAAGTVFPLVFSVQAGFSRRDAALSHLAKMKGALFTIYLMFKTWEKSPDGKWAWEAGSQSRWAAELDRVYDKLLDDIEFYLRGSRAAPEECGNVVYDGLSTMCGLMNKFAPHCGHTKSGGQLGMGRMSAYHRDIVTSFEKVRCILDTQMPVGLRLFCFALIHVSPIVLAPYWNKFCSDQNGSGSQYTNVASMKHSNPEYGCLAGYFIATTYVLILVTLYRVQKQLENPFEGGTSDHDLDDVNWELFRAHLDQLHTYGPRGPTRRAELAEMTKAAAAASSRASNVDR